MASQIEPKELSIQEQMVSIRRHMAEIDQRQQDMFWKPWQVVTIVFGGGTALLVAVITLTKLFL